jgi:tetratricopeptide (TPR) repeat protein
MKFGIGLTTVVFIVWSSVIAVGQAKLEGHVANEKKKAVSGLRIIAPGGQETQTDSKGHFIINFPASIQPGQATRIILGKPHWVVYQPPFGECTTQSIERNRQPLLVIIVPKGSPLALSPARLSQIVAELAAERIRLRSDLTAQKQNLADYAIINRYTVEYGITIDQFKAAAAQWAQIGDSDDKIERARKEYWLGNFAKVTELTGEAGPLAVNVLKQTHKQHLDEGRRVINIYKLEANAFSEQSKFTEALNSLRIIDQLFDTRELLQDDLISEWTEVQFLIADTKTQLGEKLEGEARLQLLKEALADYQKTAPFYTRRDLPQKWALVQHNSGYVLLQLSKPATGSEGVKYLNDAIKAFHAALEGFNLAEAPLDRAMTLHNLGQALSGQADRTVDWNAGNKYLIEASDAYEAALSIDTARQIRAFEGADQSSLGAVLSKLGIRLGERPESIEYLKRAVVAYRSAVALHTGEKLVQIRAVEQNKLGETLQELGERVGGSEGDRYFNEALESHRSTLEVFTPKLPKLWRLAQRGLARAYFSLRQWSQAADAYSNVLTIDEDNREAYLRLAKVYHNKLFDFEKDFVLTKQWLTRHPEDFEARAHSVETYFTTSRLTEFKQHVSNVLNDPDTATFFQTALRAIQIASLLEEKKTSEVLDRLDALIKEVEDARPEFKVIWTFDGAKHFIHENEKLLPYENWLARLFDALGSKDRDTMLRALHQVRVEFNE